MASKPTILLLLSLTTVAFSANATTEPNEIAPRPDFEVLGAGWGWVVTEEVDGKLIRHGDPGTIHPSHVAHMILPRDWTITSTDWVREETMKSPVAQKLSQAQRDFWAEGFGVRIDTASGNYPNHYEMDLYAVSEGDAKTMAWALLDVLTTQAREYRAQFQRRLDETKQQQEQRQRELSEKEKRLKEVEPQYDQHKKAFHPYLGDDEAEQLAKELVFQMEKESKMLDIELAGIRAKLETVEGYLSRSDLDNHVIERLEAVKIDQMIDFGSVDARRKAVEKIRIVEQEFCSLYRERRELQQNVPNLRSAVKREERRIETLTYQWEHPSGQMVPPRVFNNKVFIYSTGGYNFESAIQEMHQDVQN